MNFETQNASAQGRILTPNNYRFFQEYIYRESGIVLEESKDYLLESRLGPLVKKQNLQGLNELCGLLRAGAENLLRREVVEAMTTNETLFFRDTLFWEELKSKVLPELIRMRKSTRALRFWSAASSSGQEAYSLAMLLLEMGLKEWNLQIFATDISHEMVARARSGDYTQMEVNRGLPAPLLVKYFSHKGMRWSVNDAVKRPVRFEQLDLRQNLQGVGNFDIVFCRNVLIYFDIETKRRVLRALRDRVSPGGCLALGSAETTLNVEPSLRRKPATRASFYDTCPE